MRWLIFVSVILGTVSFPLQAEQVDLLVYAVDEPGVTRYISRILVNDAWVRLDEGGESAGGYTLYDRVGRVIYNVDPESQTVLLMAPGGKQPVLPGELKLTQSLTADPEAPAVAGKRVSQLKLFANGEPCRTLQVAEGVMPKALQGMRELRLTLARLQEGAATLPGASLSACEMAEYLYAPVRALDHGLPLVDEMGGKRQWLIDFNPLFEVSDALFQVPADYERVEAPSLLN